MSVSPTGAGGASQAQAQQESSFLPKSRLARQTEAANFGERALNESLTASSGASGSARGGSPSGNENGRKLDKES